MKRSVVSVFLVVAALALCAGMLEFTQKASASLNDGREMSVRPDWPVVVWKMRITDMACQAPPPVSACAITEVSGLFARKDVPRLLAMFGGLLVPPLLVLTAAAYASRRRWVTIIALIGSACVFAGAFLSYKTHLVEYRAGAGRVAYEFASDNPAALPIITTKIQHDGPLDWVTGIYPLPEVSRQIAVGGGIGAPILLLAIAFFMAVWHRRPGSSA